MIHSLLFDLAVLCVFVAMMMVLVLAHEYGHYLFAKLCKMGIEEFAIGFGKPVLCTYRIKESLIPVSDDEAEAFAHSKADHQRLGGGSVGLVSQLEGGSNPYEGEIIEKDGKKFLKEKTRFTIRAWPLGGFVRIKGMVPDENSSEVKIPGGFYQKSPFKRFLVLLAGPLFSVLAGVIFLIPYNMAVGAPKADPSPVVAGIAEGMPAMKAGINLGDRVVAVNGKPIDNFYQILTLVKASGGHPVSVEVNRKGEDLTFQVTPVMDQSPTPVLGPDLEPTADMETQFKIGIAWRQMSVPVSFGEAVVNSVLLPWETVAGLAQSVVHPAQIKNNVGGPETMIKLTADATSAGFYPVMFLAALLSISLGVFNLLPFPPLDGGQMAIAVVEMLRRGKRLSLKVQSMVFSAGLAVVGVMVISILFLDFLNGMKPVQNIKMITAPPPTQSQSPSAQSKVGHLGQNGQANPQSARP